jgi:hypothetical protein
MLLVERNVAFTERNEVAMERSEWLTERMEEAMERNNMLNTLNERGQPVLTAPLFYSFVNIISLGMVN